MTLATENKQTTVRENIVARTVGGALLLFGSLPPEHRTALKEMLMEFLDSEDDEERHEAGLSIVELCAPDGYFDVNESFGLDEWVASDDATKEAVATLTRQKEQFAAALRRLLAERKWSQADLAEKLGVTQPTVCAMANGRHKPQPRTLQRLAEAFAVRVDELWPS